MNVTARGGGALSGVFSFSKESSREAGMPLYGCPVISGVRALELLQLILSRDSKEKRKANDFGVVRLTHLRTTQNCCAKRGACTNVCSDLWQLQTRKGLYSLYPVCQLGFGSVFGSPGL